MIKEIRNVDIILPTYFLGSTLTYAMYFKGNVIIEAHENYQKRSTRNKCFIKTAQGKKPFSIPLMSGKNQQQTIKEVKISYNENWVKEFRHTMETNYASSPYIQHYLPEIIQVIEQEPTFLWQLNWELNDLILQFLSIDHLAKVSTLWQASYDDETIDLRKKSIDSNLSYQYPQLFEEKGQTFINNLSILDLLFCCGPEARLHLINMAEHINV